MYKRDWLEFDFLEENPLVSSVSVCAISLLCYYIHEYKCMTTEANSNKLITL